jgi:CheY-like chemotaxis protein
MRNSMPILFVEDDYIDAIIFKRALKDAEITNPLVHVNTCKEALEYPRDQDSKKPCIILTDLNMPEMNGFEFLEAVKADDLLSQIPVIVLSGSDTEEDVAKSFKLGAAGYMVKPIDYKNLVEMVRIIHKYWSLSKLPGSCWDYRVDHTTSLRAAVKQ